MQKFTFSVTGKNTYFRLKRDFVVVAAFVLNCPYIFSKGTNQDNNPSLIMMEEPLGLD